MNTMKVQGKFLKHKGILVRIVNDWPLPLGMLEVTFWVVILQYKCSILNESC